MCELGRLSSGDVKEVIMSYEHFQDEATADNLTNAFVWLETALIEKCGVIAGKILCAEFMTLGIEFRNNIDNPEYGGLAQTFVECSEVNEYIFKDTGFDKGGLSNVGHFLLSAFALEVNSLITFKYLFHNFMGLCTGYKEKDETEWKILELFGALMGAQHIDFKIMGLDGELASVYGIQTCLSLLAFEFANSYNNNVWFGKCRNCGKYFVLSGRHDAVYCPYPAPKHEKKTCREIGAQVTRANKEKNDIMTGEYRKIYMRLKMQARRHPKDSGLQRKVDSLVSEGKEWRKNWQMA